jgi:hypothetical protein
MRAVAAALPRRRSVGGGLRARAYLLAAALALWWLAARAAHSLAFAPAPARPHARAPARELTFASLHPHGRPPRGCIIYLSGSAPPDIADLLASLASLHAAYTSVWPTPVLLLVEGGALEAAAGAALRAAAGGAAAGGVTFVDVTRALAMPWRAALTLPAWLLPSGARWALHKRGLFSYGRMCRFFSGPVAQLPALADFDFFWRLDTDSRLDGPAVEGGDVFARMAARSLLYGYSSFMHEPADYLQGMLAAADAHAARVRLPRAAWLARLRRGADGSWWQFWTNFEVVSLHLLRSPEARSLFVALDARAGWFEHRWGDAPARTLLLAMHVGLRSIARLCHIAYSHGHVSVASSSACLNATDVLSVDATLAAALDAE